MNVLGSYCVHSCKVYFTSSNGCSNTFSPDGNCNMPIEENGQCIVPTLTTITNGDSGNYGPCVMPGHYVRNYSCTTCSGPSDFIDYQGINCLSSCAAADFIYTPSFKICSSGSTCLSFLTLTSQNGKLSLSCAPCTARTLGLFCVSSCRSYAALPNCLSNPQVGNCGFQFVDPGGALCTASCSNSDFIYSDSGEMVCIQSCQPAQFSQLNENSLAIVCSNCPPPNIKIGMFCITRECELYYTDADGCNRSNSTAGNCNAMWLDSGCYTCTSQDPFVTCPSSTYFNNFICVPCLGASEFVDPNGNTCMSSCSSEFLFAPNGVKVCGFVCGASKYNILSSDSLQHYRVSCQVGCTNGYIMNSIFCILSCRSYSAQSVC